MPAVLGVVALVVFVFTHDTLDALTTTSAVAVIALSLVVVTGYAGQLSLAQYALAGMGAWIAAKLVAERGVPVRARAPRRSARCDPGRVCSSVCPRCGRGA